MSERDCFDVVAEFARAVPNHVEYQLVGGVATAALVDEAVQIDSHERTVTLPSRPGLGIVRDNGTKRDIDVLVLSTDQKELDTVNEVLGSAVGELLVPSVFGLLSLDQYRQQQAHPFKSTGIFMSDRYVNEDATNNELYGYRSLFPFAAKIEPEALESFDMQVAGLDVMPVPHPGAAVLNYLTRSISGLRPKDADKLRKMVDNLDANNPEVIDWVIDGPGKSQFELARILLTLRQPSKNQQNLWVGGRLELKPIAGELHEHEMFMPELNISEKKARALVEVARIKSRIVHKGENFDRLVAFWQEKIEPRISGIVHNS